MKKTLYIIPAYEETMRNRGYKTILRAAKENDYDVVVLNLQIQRNSLSTLITRAENMMRGNTNQTVVFGFSTGALIAYGTATKLRIKKAILASVSPLLGSDARRYKKEIVKYFGKDTAHELERTPYRKIIAREAIFLEGEHEIDRVVDRTQKLFKKCSTKKKLIIIPDTGHELAPAYVRAIIKVL